MANHNPPKFLEPSPGRPIGSVNKKRDRAQEVFDRENFNPILELISMFKHHNTTQDNKIKIASELANYYVPKLKSVEHVDQDGNTIARKVVVNINNPPAIQNVIDAQMIKDDND